MTHYPPQLRPYQVSSNSFGCTEHKCTLETTPRVANPSYNDYR
jgi:hypothetical protein